MWDHKALTNRYFFILCISIIVWLCATAMGYLSNNAEDAFLFFRIDNFGVMYISPSFYGFSCHLTKKQRPKSIFIGFVIASFFGLLNFTNSYFSYKVNQYYWGFFPSWDLVKSIPFFVFWFGYSTASFFVLFGFLKKSKSPTEKNKIKFVILAFLFAYIGSVDYLATFGIEFYPFGFLPIFALVSIIFYAIVKHRLMDFNLLVRWGLAYGSYLVPFGLTFFIAILASEKLIGDWFQDSRGIPTVILACCTFLVFEPLRNSISKWVDKMIFHSPDFAFLLEGLESDLKENEPLHQIAYRISNNLKKLLNISHSGILLWDFNTSRYQYYPEKNFENQIISKIGIPITANDFLVRTLETERRLFKYGIVIEEELTSLGNISGKGERTTFWKIRRTMRWLGAAACVPLIANQALIGFIVLGQKVNNNLFNNEDKKLLSHLATIIQYKLVAQIGSLEETKKSGDELFMTSRKIV
ncbi:MAG: hypothetical protein KCHDKBKB_03132 [Elusimicrobia bacterium]|nr:hypothetical protein [Elusimicrobiota bacterium]